MNTLRTVALASEFGWIMSYSVATLRSASARIGKLTVVFWVSLMSAIQAACESSGSMLTANSAAILTDAFPAEQRGFALGINQVAALAGQFVGLVAGGLLAAWDWRAVFWVNVPVGIFGTIWAYARLRETAVEVGMWSGLRSSALDVLTAEPPELVGGLLDDGEVEQAWRAAVKYDCMGIEVVRERCATHPDEVLAAYRSLVEACLSRGGRDAYREAGHLLRELAEAAQRCGESAAEFVASLRERHARRPAA